MSRPQLLVINSGYVPDPATLGALSGSGYSLQQADSGEALVDSRLPPDAISLVINFRSGADQDWSFSNALSASDKPLPLVVVLDQADKAARNEALRRGAARVLIAGDRIADELLAAVTEVLSHSDTIRMQNQWLQLHGIMLGAIDAYILLLDDSGRITYRNERFLEHLHELGLPAENRAVNSLYTDIVGQLTQMSELRRTKLLKGIRNVQRRAQEKFQFTYKAVVAGEQRWLHLQVQPVNELRFRGILVTGIDITEQMAMRAERRRDEELLRNILESIDEGILVVDLDGRILLHNENASRIVGMPPAELGVLRDTVELRRAHDNSKIESDELPLVRARRNDTVQNEQVFLHRRGRERVLLNISAMPLKESGGLTYGGILTLSDVTESDRIETERSRLAHVIEQSVDIVIITDANGAIRYVNRAFEQSYGRLRADVAARQADFLGEVMAGSPPFIPPWSPAARTEQWSGRLVTASATGAQIIFDTSVSPLHDRYGSVERFVIMQRDVSAQLALEERVSQMQRIESIGKLAGGVAHDFNNLLTVVRGHTDLLLGQLAEQPELATEVQAINRAVDSAARLTSDLLSFGRRQALLTGVVSLNEIIGSKEQMIRSLLGQGIDFDLALDKRPCHVNTDRHRIEQIIINLVVNARDAMPDGGRLRIRTFTSSLNDISAQPMGLEAGNYVAMEVSDSGCGMEADVMAHIFEPFFTTKQGRKGSGLGLSSAYGIVSQNGGTITVDSTPGHGSCFTVYLAQVGDAQISRHDAADEGGEKPESAHIILVEDSEEIRRLSMRALQKQGHEVEAFGSAEAALTAVRDGEQRYDLLLTDVVLPEMAGPTLAAELEKLGLTMPVIFMSGYAHDHIQALRDRKAGKVFLQKPFTMAELSDLVRCVLEDQPPEMTQSGVWMQHEIHSN